MFNNKAIFLSGALILWLALTAIYPVLSNNAGLVEYLFYFNSSVSLLLMGSHLAPEGNFNVANKNDYTLLSISAAILLGLWVAFINIYWCLDRLSVTSGILLLLSAAGSFWLALEIAEYQLEQKDNPAAHQYIIRIGVVTSLFFIVCALTLIVKGKWSIYVCSY